jgi:hypothetical protein
VKPGRRVVKALTKTVVETALEEEMAITIDPQYAPLLVTAA